MTFRKDILPEAWIERVIKEIKRLARENGEIIEETESKREHVIIRRPRYPWEEKKAKEPSQ